MLVQVTQSGNGTENYAYAPDNRRVWKQLPNGFQEVTFWGVNGKRLGTYNYVSSWWGTVFTLKGKDATHRG